jgi:hypothetical protein
LYDGYDDRHAGTCLSRPHISALDGRLATLRQEFEKALVSPYGMHISRESCAKSWDSSPWPDVELRRQIGVATVWLSRCDATRDVNTAIGTSYALKHLAADWWRATRGGNGYSLNGAFVMAAIRLGLKVRVPVALSWGRRDFYNPHVGVSTKSVEALRKETENHQAKTRR